MGVFCVISAEILRDQHACVISEIGEIAAEDQLECWR